MKPIEAFSEDEVEAPAEGRIYHYSSADVSHSHSYILPALLDLLRSDRLPSGAKLLDFGCGSGLLAGALADHGFEVVGVDPSASGIAIAAEKYPNLHFSANTSAEYLCELGPFDAVIAVEVIAHCYDPLGELRKLRACARDGAPIILVTPFHGYWKNLAMALTGKMESHLDTSWAGAYVHYFSRRSIMKLVEEAGFGSVSITRLGRIPALARVMLVSAIATPLRA